ncbi:class I SAM-dependent DNA methyltransferase [Ornithinimicrobium sp. LYQ121]|uniref:class I SAM-dependent DNA methyltransferase n=1 Tax=Ornithinimicrobium sp. LYQ121 TaxID=3378801 RepID=UPI00385471A9
MTPSLIDRAEQRDYQTLFIRDLNWSRPDHAPVTVEHDARTMTATNVSSYKGLRVWVVDEKPDSNIEAVVDRHLARTSTDRILIFHGDTEQVWRWPVRRAVGSTTITRLSRHRHRDGGTDPRFGEKLEAIRLPLDEVLDSNAVLAKVRQAFDVEAHNETKHASKLMARLYTAMEKSYPSTTPRAVRDHEISVTLARILFLLFGDDTDMWKPDLFSDFIRDHTAADGSDIGSQLTTLFGYLDTPDNKRGSPGPGLEGFRYVNGRIFTERVTLPVLNAEFRSAVLQACDRDWASISPAIFGSMFQSVRDAETRRQLGEHYTSEENILKTLSPLFLDELRAEFQHVRTLGKYEADRLRKLREKLGRIRYLDPACGCGNFIIVAYRELRDLELAIMERLQEITGDNPMLLANVGLSVTLDHFYGIEIDEWPARIAETAMFLVDRQCDLKLTASLGHAPDRLPIQEQATIVVGNALRLDWATVCPRPGQVIVAGNPPFLGPHTRTKEQLEDLQSVWGTKDLGRLDYVTGWHRKCVDYLAGEDDGRFALVSTSSIAQGDQATRLFPYIFKNGWRLRFAHQTFAWTSEATGAAAVHCVITGFDKNNKPDPVLFEYPNFKGAPREITARHINAYLIDGPTIAVVPRSTPLAADLAKVVLGSMAKDGGHLIVEPEDLDHFTSDPIAAKYLRPYIGSRELLHGEKRWCLWLEDATPLDLSRSLALRERVAAVRAFRLDAKAPSTNDFASIPHLFTQRAAQRTTFVCIPGVSSESRPYLPCARVGQEVIASHLNYQVQDRDGLQFAILSSAMLLTWQKTIGGRLESRIRFAVRTVWNNFPLPLLSGRQRADLIAAGQTVLDARAQHPHLSLAQHYAASGMDPDLQAAHLDLDRKVGALFGVCAGAAEGDRQQALFDAYLELVPSPVILE